MDQIHTNKIVGDERMLREFLQILPELQRDEVYFLSLSARNKYLTDEERKTFDLGRTEMFSRHTAFDRGGILMAIARMEADLNVRRTRNGSEIPAKCLVCYMNIHPSSTLKAYTAFKNQLDSHYNETFMAVVNDKQPNYEPFLRSRTHLMNHIQKSSSRKLFVDIDIDCDNVANLEKAYEHIHSRLVKASIRHHIIHTQGGYHILVDKESMKTADPKFPLYRHVENANDIVSGEMGIEGSCDMMDKAFETNGEVVFNKNAMVPLPGTFQAGKLVAFASS